MTIFVAHNGAYTDNGGIPYYLPDTVFEIIAMMKLGQKVLIQEEDGHGGVKI